jgi:hypothetical protein
MKKLLYAFLFVGLIFTSCKKEEETNNDPPSPSLSIVGVWTPNSVVTDSSMTVTMMGMVIDSLSGSGSTTESADSAGITGYLEFTNNGELFVDDDTLNYIYSNNMLTLTDEDSTFSVPCSFSQTELSITINEMNIDSSWVEMGMAISISMTYSQTIHCSRNTMNNTHTEERLGKPNNWFFNPTVDKYFKDIKFNKGNPEY